mmetsp:Transcript_4935/g.13676  ORF Transcript_4935/g.13676 Transcript_4935/m.13676 type:complete len:222 (-) Transcript_4935:739-1404(-)
MSAASALRPLCPWSRWVGCACRCCGCSTSPCAAGAPFAAALAVSEAVSVPAARRLAAGAAAVGIATRATPRRPESCSQSAALSWMLWMPWRRTATPARKPLTRQTWRPEWGLLLVVMLLLMLLLLWLPTPPLRLLPAAVATAAFLPAASGVPTAGPCRSLAHKTARSARLATATPRSSAPAWVPCPGLPDPASAGNDATVAPPPTRTRAERAHERFNQGRG